MRRHLLAVALASALGATGCTHAMRITNLDTYAPAPAPPREPPLRIAVASANAADPATRGYVEAIVEGLRRTGSYDRVLYPYDADFHGSTVDLVANVTVAPRYSGRGSNFFVNWPGFLIFAPAIWGYGYEASIDTQVSLWSRGGPTQTFAVPTRFTFRQAELDRTWTEIGWFEIGLIPLIGGAAFTQYDPDLTPEFVTKVGPTYGAFVAARIDQMAPGRRTPAPRPAAGPAPSDAAPAVPAPAVPAPPAASPPPPEPGEWTTEPPSS